MSEIKIKNFVQLRNVVNAAFEERAAKRKLEIEARLRAEKVFKNTKNLDNIHKVGKGTIVAYKRKRFIV